MRFGIPAGSFRRADGFTVVELLTVLAVVALLMSLILPAVQDARENSRCLMCQNNLKQIGIALHNFEQRNGHLPNAFCGVVDWPGQQYSTWCVSPAAQLAAFLDDAPRAAQIEGTRSATQWDPRNLALDAVAVLHCPSDSLAVGPANSYRFCRGLLPIYPGDPGGVFTAFVPRRSADVRDGLAHTAFGSERLIATAAGADVERDPLALSPTQSNDVAMGCVAANHGGAATGQPVSGHRPMGTVWTSGSWTHCAYYHFFPPNTPWRDCLPDSGDTALVTARANHRGGVNVVFGDGHVRLAANEIDVAVWRAWGTRDGHEAF